MDLTIYNSNDDKDILIMTLLEYICKNRNPSSFTNIVTYLQTNNIISHLDQNDQNYINQKNAFMMILHNFIKNHNSRYSDDFIEIGKISSGGYGIVYKSINRLDKIQYAIKKIPLKYVTDNKNILNEVMILAHLNHNNIIRYHSTWIEDNIDNSILLEYSESNSLSNGLMLKNDTFNNILYIQMELCTMTLKEFIKTPISKNETYIIIKDIVKALAYLHSKNIIHCDLTLNNILISKDKLIKLCDFGLAEYISDGDHIIKSKTYGTQTYLAPECINKFKYSYKSDIYSLAIIIFELLNKFNTDMERALMIKKFKNKKVKCLHDKILYIMIDDDENKRPLIKDINFFM